MPLFVRELHEHKSNPCNHAIVLVADAPNPKNGNASHCYQATWLENDGTSGECVINFQDGPIKEVGTNGVTQEVLLAVLIDRLRGFQTSKYACRENAIALTKLEEALHWLNARTAARVARGVEGTHQK